MAPYTRKNTVVGMGIAAFVVGVYAYTIFRVKQVRCAALWPTRSAHCEAHTHCHPPPRAQEDFGDIKPQLPTVKGLQPRESK